MEDATSRIGSIKASSSSSVFQLWLINHQMCLWLGWVTMYMMLINWSRGTLMRIVATAWKEWDFSLVQLNLILVMLRQLEGPNLRWWIQQPKESPCSYCAAHNGVLATHQNIWCEFIHGSHGIPNKRTMQRIVASHTHLMSGWVPHQADKVFDCPRPCH